MIIRKTPDRQHCIIIARIIARNVPGRQKCTSIARIIVRDVSNDSVTIPIATDDLLVA